MEKLAERFSVLAKKTGSFLHSRQFFVGAVIFVVLVKLALLPFSAHPYDFWSFVNTFERRVLFNWDLFEYWNKGNFLIVLWYPMYSLYLIALKLLHQAPDNIYLLHLAFKLPFLAVDLFSGWLVYLIIFRLKQNHSLARLGFWFWFLNPIIFYAYGIHGHYEILIPFSLLLLFYGLIDKRTSLIVLGFLIGFTTKYFFLIFLPFILIYLLYNRQYLKILYISLVSAIGLALSYLHLFLNHDNLIQTANSFINLSQSNAPVSIERLSLPALNLFSAINYLFYPEQVINNIDNPSLFNFANNGLKIAAVTLIIHLIVRVVLILFKKKYDYHQIFADLSLAIIYLLIFITNFQPHYLAWLVPMFIIVALVYDRRILYPFIAFTFIGFCYVIRNELGPQTFFLDLINYRQYQIFSLDDTPNGENRDKVVKHLKICKPFLALP